MAFVAVAGLVLGLALAAVLVWMNVVRPRLGLYALLAITPLQFIFLPVGSFFLSPADGLALAAAAAFALRLTTGAAAARRAVWLHVMLLAMIGAYLVGFVALDYVSRTLVRVPLAIVPSLLACELIRTRQHLRTATAALVVAGLVDAAYGAAFAAIGQPLHPTRFSGMMGVNFSAIVILTAAAVAFARVARTREPVKFLLPAGLALAGVATLSKMGILALGIAALVVVLRIATRANRRLLVTAAIALVVLALSQGAVRQRVLARAQPELQLDGVYRTSTDVRAMILQAAWTAFGEHPFVGIGYHGFERYSRQDQVIWRSTGGVGYATHNTYVEILVEGGLLAIVAFLAHFFTYALGMKSAWLAVVRHRDPLVAAGLAGLTVMLVSASAANLLLHYQFWAACGVALACIARCREEGPRAWQPGPVIMPG